MVQNNFDYTSINAIVESIKQLTDDELDELLDISVKNGLTEDPDGLKQTFLDIRSGKI